MRGLGGGGGGGRLYPLVEFFRNENGTTFFYRPKATRIYYLQRYYAEHNIGRFQTEAL